MRSRFHAVLLAVLAAGLFATPVHGAPEPTGSRPEVITNKDIERYKLPSDAHSQSPTRAKTAERDEKARKSGEKEEQEYWCKRATYYNKKVEKARAELEKQEERLAELREDASKELDKKRKGVEKEIKRTREKIRNAQREVKEREKELDRVEHEAHKKGIPPGWLRCQFAW